LPAPHGGLPIRPTAWLPSVACRAFSRPVKILPGGVLLRIHLPRLGKLVVIRVPSSTKDVVRHRLSRLRSHQWFASTHKTPAIHRWLLRHPRFVFHFTPTHSSWLNLVERWFAELTERWLRRGSHRSTKELVASIRTWTACWNDDPKPLIWHKSADEILETLASYCDRISDSGH
jgi:transposase